MQVTKLKKKKKKEKEKRKQQEWRHTGLMVSVLTTGLSSPGSSPS